MKPLSEFAEELVESREFYEVAYQYRNAQMSDQREVAKSFKKLKAHVKGKLQAWLREAEPWVWHYADQEGTICVSDIQGELLGTTRQEGSPEKLSLKGKK
jgi:hypothetical protein